MNDNKQFISKWSNWWSMSRDGKALTEAFAKELDDIIFSSRSASPQQGTEGAEEVLMKTDKLNIDIVDTANGKILHIMLVDAIKAMHQFAASQVEQAVKEKDKQISDLTFFNQEHQSYQNLSEIVIGRQKEQITQLEHALKVQTDKVGELEKANESPYCKHCGKPKRMGEGILTELCICDAYK